MEQLKIFENEEFGQIRTVMRDGEVWFVGKDVAEALGFTNSRDAIATHVFDDDKGVEIISRNYRHPWRKAEDDGNQ